MFILSNTLILIFENVHFLFNWLYNDFVLFSIVCFQSQLLLPYHQRHHMYQVRQQFQEELLQYKCQALLLEALCTIHQQWLQPWWVNICLCCMILMSSSQTIKNVVCRFIHSYMSLESMFIQLDKCERFLSSIKKWFVSLLC